MSATRAQGSAQMPSGSGGMRMEVDDVELIPIYSQLPEYPFLLPWTSRVAQPGSGCGSGPLDSLSAYFRACWLNSRRR